MLRIAIDARDAAAAEPRGWQRYTIELVRALRELPDLGLRELRTGWPGPEAVYEQLGLPIEARGADVLHAPNCFLPLLRPCAGVVTIHDLAFEVHPDDFRPRTRAKFRTLTPLAARSAQRVIVPSESTRADVCERYRVDPERVRVVPEAPALPVGTAPVTREAYLLGVGDLRAKKNWLRLVRAWRALRADGLPHRLVIAGIDSGEGPALREAAGAEPLALPGYVSDERLDALMRGAAALVHPSLYEGFGLVVLEALARGTPVAAARATSLPEVGGDCVEYFDPLDEDDLARAVLRALERPGVLPDRFSWRRTAEMTVQVYREAAA